MTTMARVLLVGWFLLSATLASASTGSPDEFWGQWRGPSRSGLAPRATPPAEWSESKNVRWKVKLPGEGASSPIVWGDRVYVQAAVPTDKPAVGRNAASAPAKGKAQASWSFEVLAFERKTGKQVWERVVCEGVPHEGHHPDGSFSAGSPMTDGEHVYAYFGSRGLYCLTMQGEVAWTKDFGDMQIKNTFGEGNSPVLHGDTIVVNWDHEGGSFIVALDKRSGEQKWKQARNERSSWSTPLILADANPPQVVTSASVGVRSYDLASGKLIWECTGLGLGVVATPVSGAGFVYVLSGRDPVLLAIRYAGATGDITGSDKIVWRLGAGVPYVPSPLLCGEMLYLGQKNDGMISCYNGQTGKPHYSGQRLDQIKGLYASPVAADGRVYIVGRNGVAYVLKQGPKFEVVAINKLEDRFTASPAPAGGEIYLRGHQWLYCIAAD